MSHDIEAAYAASEVVKQILGDPNKFFATPPSTSLSGYAAREGRHSWPFADGVVELVDSTKTYSVAVEFKRPNEGIHGVLTAIGQSHAYLQKGYSGALIVVPDSYAALSSTGTYIKELLNHTSPAQAIGVFTYSKPDLTKTSPFAGCLTLHRDIKIDLTVVPSGTAALGHTETQWAHVREGSTDPDAFFKYLQSVKLLGGGGLPPYSPSISPHLAAAVSRLRPGHDPDRYLSNCPGNDLPDRAWRYFWFKYVLHPGAIEGWDQDTSGAYHVNSTSSLIERSDGAGKKLFFVGRSDSIKNKTVISLNSGSMTLDEAYEALAFNYHSRVHSYREDIDSGCEHLGFVDSEGRLTDEGYRFVDAGERFGDANAGYPRAVFTSAVLIEGGLGAFLHYVYRLSEERFTSDPLSFTTSSRSRLEFVSSAYLSWLENEMANNLRVMRKVSARGGATRRPFQAELAILRQLKIARGFRIGLGLEINWPEFQQYLTQQIGSG